MNDYKKTIAILIFVIYIFANLSFNNSIYNEYTNFKMFIVTSHLFVMEILFWVTIFLKIRNKGNKEEIKFLFSLFMIGIIGVSGSRIFLSSSPYLNDLVLNNIILVYMIGFFRVLAIFSSFIFVFFSFSQKNIFLILISLLNFVVNILIWVEFDSNINVIIRILIGIISIIYIIIKDRNKNLGGKND